MRSARRHPLLVPALVCALAVLAVRPSDAEGDGGAGGAPGVSAEVARLHADAALAARRYAEGRQEAEAERARARLAEEQLDRQRREVAVLHQDLGRLARAQYRDGGGLPAAVRLVLAESPQELMRGQQVFTRANLAVGSAVGRSRRAESRLAADEARATAARRAVEQRTAELAAAKNAVERRLDEARGRLQGQVDASVAAGACRGAVRLDQPTARSTRAWVTPVETYELSAGFGSGGSRWAHGHTGQDFAVPIGTPVRAVGAGRVVRVSCGGAFGIEVVVRHDGGFCTQYAHLAAVTVDQGQRVAAGQWVGQSGTTGNSTGPHLHFEVRATPDLGSGVDPVPWLGARGVPLE
ncbi:M23 family metallopeptidase [Streptomyces sp. NPDC091279]|uniref:M23 family metallopeptidase n=1 Tax=Streptomyces sp. NPDC091279 TaxID=3365983 RepID=UPI0037F43E41